MKKKGWLILFLWCAYILSGFILPLRVYAGVLFPAGGETLYKGNTYLIHFEEFFRDVPHGIYLEPADGVSINIGTALNGYFRWYVDPSTPVTNLARLRISYVQHFEQTDPWIPPPRPVLHVCYSHDFKIAEPLPVLRLPLTPLIAAPAAPSNMSATAESAVSISLSWNDNSSGEEGFLISRKAEGGDWADLTAVGPNVTSYLDTELTPLTKYYYKVCAYNTIGFSTYSSEASATTLLPTLLPPLTAAPAAPSGLTATAVSAASISLTWTDSSSTEEGFKIMRKTGRGDWISLPLIGPNITYYLDEGRLPSTIYYYKICAYNTVGSSVFSNEASATTLPPREGQTEIRFNIGSTRYYEDGFAKTMDAAPLIYEGRTLLPIRFVAEPLGASVGWDASQQKATVTLGVDIVELWIAQNRARVNGTSQYIDTANHNVVPIIVPPGRTMLPLRFIAEALGCQVVWDAVAREVTITYPAP